MPPHFRAHGRRGVRLPIEIARSGAEPHAAELVDLGLAGAGVETEEPLVVGERVQMTLSTPTLWDPLVLDAVVAWSGEAGTHAKGDPRARSRSVARAGLAFDYASPSVVLAMFGMLATVGYE